jgi:hypothetical protein
VERLRFPAVAETTVVDTGLLPAHSYRYAARLEKEGQTAARSNPVELTTMDTTSHDFSWQLYEFGGVHGSSVLYDVAIINENDIWAVGEIHTAETDTFDSLGNWVNPYNAVHWNGSEWELRRILYDNSFWTIKAIYAFSSNDIWFSAFVRWDGTNFIELPIPDILIGYGINKIWGTSSNDLYLVGTQGLIVHYDGQRWERMESGTDVNLLDVWGSPDGSVVWACGFTDFVGTVLLKITGKTIKKVYDDQANWGRIRQDSLSGTLTSLWTNNPEKIYIMSPAGMYRTSANSNGEAERIWLNNHHLPGFPHILRGNAENDLFTSGDFSMIAHFNGKSWYQFSELTGRMSFRGVASIHDKVFCVGEDYSSLRAIIAIGTGL